MKLGVASVRSDRRENRSDRRENRSKYAPYSVVQKRRYYAIHENCRELHDVSRRMTTLLQRADISGRLLARYFRPGRLRLTIFRGGVFGAVFTPVYLHATERSCQKICGRVRCSNRSCGA